MIKTKLMVFHLLFFLLFMSGIKAQVDANLCHQENTVCKSGEKLTYSLYYNWNFIWISAGWLEFEIIEEGEYYYANVTGKTHDSYNWFFEVDDHYSSMIRTKDMMPLSFKRDITEGDYHLVNEINFDYENDIVLSSVRINEGETSLYTFEMNDCIHDLISLCYNLRNMDIDLLKNTKHIMTDLVFDDQIFHIPMKYLGEVKNKKVKKLGRFDLMKVSPDLIEGHVFDTKSQMIIWVSNDENRIPVLIETPIKVGKIKAVLKSYENIKEPWKNIKN